MKKSGRRLLGLFIFIFSISLATVVGCGGNSGGGGSDDLLTTFLVLRSDTATFAPTSDGEYNLTLGGVSPLVTLSSDQSDRFASALQAEDLVNDWGELFGEDLANAALAAADETNLALTLGPPTWDATNSDLTFSATPLEGTPPDSLADVALFVDSPLPQSVVGSTFIADVYLPGSTWEATVDGESLSKGDYCKIYSKNGNIVGNASPVSFKGSRVYAPDNCSLGTQTLAACYGAWCGDSKQLGVFCIQGTEGYTTYGITGPEGQTASAKISWNYQCARPGTKSVKCEITTGWTCAASWRQGDIKEGLAVMIGTFRISPP